MTPLNILFIGADAGGNVPPAVAVSREPVARGHRVAFAGMLPRDQGVEPVPLPALVGHQPGLASNGAAQMSDMARMGMSRGVARQVRQVIAQRHPDVVLIDGIMISSIREATRVGPPVAVLFHSFGAVWSGRMSQGPAKAVLGPFGLSPLAVWNAADARLLLTDRELDPLTDQENTIGFEWTGTTEHGAPPAPRSAQDPPLVLVSLSSVWQRRQDDVYRRVIAALGRLPVRAIVTRSTPQTPLGGDIPPNVEVRGRASHAELLPHATLVIGHGGHSTTLAALAHGVPLLVLPMNATSDQPLIGRIVESQSVGRVLPRSALAPELEGAISGLLADTRITSLAAQTGMRLRAQRGAVIAADRIEQLAA
ncbi:glycosyltransferase [Microbacterium bovistercoris]|uniref:Glycosyltransferase n=1 Tax=Microbacterium bovistercoris TaxID=2293570 RepID=A0A371NVJ8_9MICO|nr:nucleotide disphospho-sugar-binding domain-containing protein [Microbacterium bovistercoris]REJ06646.1 glycosyltransferase [Microbacterium bovistercoris]